MVNKTVKCAKCGAKVSVEIGKIEVDFSNMGSLKNILNEIIKTSRILMVLGNNVTGFTIIHRKVKIK